MKGRIQLRKKVFSTEAYVKHMREEPALEEEIIEMSVESWCVACEGKTISELGKMGMSVMCGWFIEVEGE